MRAVVVSPGEMGSVRLEERDVPTPGKGELLLRVIRVGVCGTDRDIAEGLYGQAPPGEDTLVVGHESLCRVEDPGLAGWGFRKGSFVVPTVRRGCPQKCLNCRNGESDMCLTGNYTEHGIKGLNGFASDYATSDRRHVVVLQESIGEEGVLLEPLTVVEKALAQTFAVQSSRMKWKPRNALVLGAGPVGILATAMSRLRGMEVSTVATRPEGSLKSRLVESTGANYVDVKETPLQSLEGKWDVVLELTGNASVALEAERLTSVNGVVCYLGIYRSQPGTSNMGQTFTQLVLGNRLWFGSVNANRSYFEMGKKDLVRIKRRWPELLSRIVTRKVTPEDLSEAYSSGDKEELKTVVQFE